MAGSLLWPLYGCRCAESRTAAAPLRLYGFQAGKADAFLLTTAGSAVLIDTGEKGFGKEIAAYLEEQGVRALDVLILTHFDKDHMGGAAKVLRSVPVRQVLQSNCPKDSKEYRNYEEALAEAGLTPVTVREMLHFEQDGVPYTVDPPRQETYPEDASNNASLIVSMGSGSARMLFTGDAGDARLAEFLAEEQGAYELVKLPHHGRWQETLPALLEATQPRCAVIACSEEKLEDAQTSALLERLGIETFLTRKAPVQAVNSGGALEAAYAEQT